MSKNQFRSLIIASLVIGLLSGVYDYMWADPVHEKVFEFIVENEPEIEGAKLIAFGVIGMLVVVMAVIAFVGLLLFKSWARHLYLASMAVAFCIYPFMGITICSGLAQVFYDSSMVLSGIVLALMYYSPIASYYENKI